MNALARLGTGFVSAVVEAMEELRIHRGRVLLSLVGVAVAVCALATVVGAGAVAEQGVRESSERGGGRAATATFNVNAATPPDAESVSSAWTEVLERYGVAYGTRLSFGEMLVQFTDGAVTVPVQAVDPAYGIIHRVRVSEGTWFDASDAERLAPAVVISEAFWDRLGRPPLATHPTVELLGEGGRTAVVVGVTPRNGEWDTEPSAFMLADAYAALPVPGGTGSSMMGSLLPSFEAWIDQNQADPIIEAIRRDFAAALGEGVQVDGFRTDYAAFGEDPLLFVKLLVIGVAVVILLLGALGLVNIALVTVRTRIREIGIRRTFGATAGRVFFAVMMESVVGTFVAGVVGVGVAILLVRSPLMSMLLGGGELEDLPGFPIEAAVIGLGSAVLVGALAGLLPAFAAIRVRVIDAIRF
ncbi:ABC transporter permease [Agromyces sp. NPDC060279]|uniref:ABC transporter permease n=1 Tax=Agromyces sp. NPDC060279 TaxID=3347092 RepID=UPI003665B714